MNKVLILEDDIDLQKLVKIHFELEGVEVVFASSVEQAIERFIEHEDDIVMVITDFKVEDGDSLPFIRWLRSPLDRLPRFGGPVVGMSGSGEHVLQQMSAYGCDLVLQKPVQITQLANLAQHASRQRPRSS